MCSHQLLLLVQRVEEAERVCAEPDDRHDRQQHDRAEGAPPNTRTLAPGAWGEHHEREHQSG